MKEKAIAYYSIFVGISVIAMWTMILMTQTLPEGPVELTFHLLSEFLMAILVTISGILLLKKASSFAKLLNVVGLGMIIYSVLNAAGYYGQKGETPMMVMFIALFFLTGMALTGHIRPTIIEK